MSDLKFNVMTWNYGKHSDGKMKNALNAMEEQDLNALLVIMDKLLNKIIVVIQVVILVKNKIKSINKQ